MISLENVLSHKHLIRIIKDLFSSFLLSASACGYQFSSSDFV